MTRGRALAFAGFAALVILGSAGCLSPIVGAECSPELSVCDGSCVDLADDPLNCGGCGVVCDGTCSEGTCIGDTSGGNEIAAWPDGSSQAGADAGPVCDPGYTMCADGCTDLQVDPDNCGMCGNVCDSGLCDAGVCRDTTSGHVILIGHDYVSSPAGASRLVGNAVFLATGSPVRVFAYRGTVTHASQAGTNAAINQVANELGRRWREIDITDTGFPAVPTSADVLLIYAQAGGADADLRALGKNWSAELRDFVDAGGTVVSLDGPAPHAGTWQILASAGLIDPGGRTTVAAPTVSVIAPADAVARQVPLTYAASEDTVSFDRVDGQPVVADGARAVVLHKVFP